MAKVLVYRRAINDASSKVDRSAEASDQCRCTLLVAVPRATISKVRRNTGITSSRTRVSLLKFPPGRLLTLPMLVIPRDI